MIDDHREELIAKVANSIVSNFLLTQEYLKDEGMSTDEAVNKSLADNLEEFLKVRQEIKDNGITMEELINYLKKKGKIENLGSENLASHKNLLFYIKEAFVVDESVFVNFVKDGSISADDKKDYIDKWVNDEVIGGFVTAFAGFSKEMEKMLNAAVFKLEIVDEKVKCTTAQCYFTKDDDGDSFEEYASEFTKGAYLSIEIRHLERMELLNVAYIRNGKIQKLYYFSFKNKEKYEVKSTPDIVFSDKESHDNWVKSKIQGIEKVQEEKLKESIKEIFGGNAEIYAVNSTNDLKKIIDDASNASKKKNKQSGRFDFLDN